MKARLLFALALALALTACAADQPGATPASATAGSVHFVVAIQGDMSVKRLGWSAYAPASFGMILRDGDLVRLDGPSQATVACSDLTVSTSRAGVSSVPCKVSKPVLVYGNSLIVPTRADAPLLDIPIVLAPRKTKVLAERPIVRWAAVSGASTYSVTVRGPNLNWSGSVTGKTETVYPDNAPPLAAGQSYKVSVSAGARTSDQETTPGLGFTVLKADEAQAVRAGEERIRRLGLSDAATRLLLANLYASLGLNADAIDLMESLARSSHEPTILRSLGDLYLKVSLNRMAEERYVQALDLAQKANDTEGQAAANNALGLVYESMGNKADAIQRSLNAVEWYQKLGDNKTIKQIQDRLAALQR